MERKETHTVSGVESITGYSGDGSNNVLAEFSETIPLENGAIYYLDRLEMLHYHFCRENTDARWVELETQVQFDVTYYDGTFRSHVFNFGDSVSTNINGDTNERTWSETYHPSLYLDTDQVQSIEMHGDMVDTQAHDDSDLRFEMFTAAVLRRIV